MEQANNLQMTKVGSFSKLHQLKREKLQRKKLYPEMENISNSKTVQSEKPSSSQTTSTKMNESLIHTCFCINAGSKMKLNIPVGLMHRLQIGERRTLHYLCAKPDSSIRTLLFLFLFRTKTQELTNGKSARESVNIANHRL